MNASLNSTDSVVWNESPKVWTLFLAAVFLLGLMAYDGLADMVHRWNVSEEYGYGYLIPFITVFFIFQKKNELALLESTGAWFGFAVVVIGTCALFLGELSTLYVLVQYSFLLVLFGLVLAFTGWRMFRHLLVPLLILVFMIPLPAFIYQGLSANLQLMSSELGVAVIRLFGISVYLEGNVIDLGKFKLQVVEACSGLRYLFPLVSLSFIAAYIFDAPMWKRAVVFLSSIPITIFMNSFRIGVIGVLVEYYGSSMAEGFLHDFEGWFVFMACLGVLLLEIILITRITGDKRPFAEIFSLDWPEPLEKGGVVKSRKIPAPFFAALAVLVLGVSLSMFIDDREEDIPSRANFSDFPLVIGDWKGKRDVMEQIYIDTLKFDDYIMVDYSDDSGNKINFYAAYYGSQRKGESAHSPRSCIPGGGWQIKTHETKNIPLGSAGESMQVNRLVIQKGAYRQLVYYWFDQRGRTITNEYLVKWYLFQDSIMRNRSDGALVRLVVQVPEGSDLSKADQQLTEFVRQSDSLLKSYIPE